MGDAALRVRHAERKDEALGWAVHQCEGCGNPQRMRQVQERRWPKLIVLQECHLVLREIGQAREIGDKHSRGAQCHDELFEASQSDCEYRLSYQLRSGRWPEKCGANDRLAGRIFVVAALPAK